MPELRGCGARWCLWCQSQTHSEYSRSQVQVESSNSRLSSNIYCTVTMNKAFALPVVTFGRLFIHRDMEPGQTG